MRFFLYVICFLSLNDYSFAEKKLKICDFSEITSNAINHSNNDKNRHCTVSCYLRFCYPGFIISLIGLEKELIDLIGPGNSEKEDYEAGERGVKIANQIKSSSIGQQNQCLESCDQYYSK